MNLHSRSSSFLMLIALSAPAFSALAQPSPAKWGAHIDIEAKPGSKRTLGEADFFLPLAQDARTLWFANLRGRFADHDNREGNLGLGVRHMREDGWNLGAYGYLDRRRTANGNHFNQATLGAEALGRDWDFRANAYLPFGTKARDLGTASSAAISGAAVQVTTVTREERALKGFDAELGWRAPLFDSEGARQLRLYAGGYRFANKGVEVEGPRLRAEFALDDLAWFGKGTRLYLGAETQHDDARGSQNFLSVRLRIPLGKEDARPSALNWQERRMTAPVMRDVDIVTQSRIAATLVENATATAGGQTVAVVDSAATPGAAALQAALDAAGADSTVILSGTFDTGTNNTIFLNVGQTLMGRGTLTVSTPSGRTATLVASSGATIASTSTAIGFKAINMQANSTLTGMTLTPTTAAVNAQATAVWVNGISGATISNNTITVTSPNSTTQGVRIEGAGASNITVSGNTITASNSNGGGVAIGLFMAGTSVNLTNNVFSVSADNQYAVYRTAGTITASGNAYLTSAGCSNGGAGMPCP